MYRVGGFIIFLLIFSLPLVGQNHFQIELDLGYAFQKELKLDNQPLDNTGAVGVRLGANYLRDLSDKVFLEIGTYGKYNRGLKKTAPRVTFITQSVKLQFPLYLGYKYRDSWRWGLGVSIENNKDLNKIDFKKIDNYRYDLLTKIVWQYDEHIMFSFYAHWMLNSTPDIYTLSSPKNGVYLGIVYQFAKRDKSKEE